MSARADFSPPDAFLRRGELPGDRPWLRLTEAAGRLEARTAAEVPALLREVEAQAARGRIAAGFVAYEAAPALDPALRVRAPGRGDGPAPPAAWFALFREARGAWRPPAGGKDAPATAWAGRWRPSLSARAHARAVAAVRERIAAGDTYQVNLTLRLRARLARGVGPRDLFAALQARQRARHAALLETGGLAVCCVSPELFFLREGGRVVMRPMKGTRPRGSEPAADRRLAADLRASAKDRAENVMIVDMVRNDLGRVARTGSVRVERLFAVERYPTVLQMTSTVSARTRAPLPELFAALFPCASVTGAPKPATMGIIADLEDSPRGVYCGAVGLVLPGGRAQFGVAIRTAVVTTATGAVEYGVGGGVVWDSTAAGEWAECRAKAAVLPA